MTFDTRSSRSRSISRQLVLVALVGATSWSCTQRRADDDGNLYSQGRIHVDAQTKQRWDAAERDVEAAAMKIRPIHDGDSSMSIPVANVAPATLRALQPSERHGAGDKRILSAVDTSGGRKVVRSSGVLAEVTLVRGSEYKSQKDFQSGWLPLAIVVLPPRAKGDPVVYPKLGLHGDTSWVFVRERANSSWVGSLVRIVDGKVEQTPLDVTASTDSLEPVLGARFAWEDDDESIWGACGVSCCKMIVHKSL